MKDCLNKDGGKTAEKNRNSNWNHFGGWSHTPGGGQLSVHSFFCVRI